MGDGRRETIRWRAVVVSRAGAYDAAHGALWPELVAAVGLRDRRQRVDAASADAVDRGEHMLDVLEKWEGRGSALRVSPSSHHLGATPARMPSSVNAPVNDSNVPWTSCLLSSFGTSSSSTSWRATTSPCSP